MNLDTTDFDRLELLVNRILDAETLTRAQEQALLSESEAIGHELAAGDAEAACAHIERIVALIETLLETRALALSDGQAVIQTAHCILNARQGTVAHDTCFLPD